jgi:hypothetical protein
MLIVNHASLPNASHNGHWHNITESSLILFSLLVMAILVRGDELTGLPQNDPKDLLTFASTRPPTTGGMSFLPMPSWSRVGALSPLPDKLRPMGNKVVVMVTPPTAAPAALAPPKETPPAAATPTETASKGKASPPPAETSPALAAVSPFLQWIKSNPQAAAAEARQQANSYRAPSTSAPCSSSGAGSTGSTGATDVTEVPYWLPPLLDSGESAPRSVAGSAAIYQTPQR